MHEMEVMFALFGIRSLLICDTGKHWIKSMLVTGGLFPGICFIMAFLLNFIAIGYGTLGAFPAGTVVCTSLIRDTIWIRIISGRGARGGRGNEVRVQFHQTYFIVQFAVLAIWLFISYPMTFVGTVFGKNWNGQPDNPCRINPVPRRIPENKVRPLICFFLLCFPSLVLFSFFLLLFSLRHLCIFVSAV